MPKDRHDAQNNHNNHRRQHRIMSPEDLVSGKKPHWEQLEIVGTIRNLSPQLWNLRFLTALYLNDNNLTRVPAEICKLTSLTHLDLSANKLRSLPVELGDLVTLRELLLNNNYLRSLPFEMGRLFQLQVLGLKGNPLNSDVLGIYNEHNGTPRLLSYMLDNISPPNTLPPTRPWIHINDPDRSRPAAIFSVMSYNVLCDKYATKQLYGYCPTWALSWDYRRKGIMDEILHASADLICLQEVETDQYFNFFYPSLHKHGYDGVFSPKSRAKTMSEHERKYVDGCAIFFRTSKFGLVKEHLVEFNQLAMANADGNEDMLNRVMTKDNIGLAVLLETRAGCYDSSAPAPDNARQLMLVANVHIHWDPEYSDVKLIQTIMFMNELKKIMDEESVSFRPGGTPRSQDTCPIPLVLCGDLNSLPDSGVLEYLENGKVSVHHEDFKDIHYKVLRNFSSSTESNGHITHPFSLRRAYHNQPMQYTNYTYEFKGVIDYIFTSSNFMSTLGVLGPVEQEWLDQSKIVGCPHASVPSDHFSLLTEFEMPYLPPGSSAPNTSTSGSFSIVRR
ncbi:CCR4-NOT transcription complex subunit 6-like [Acanthaster planci]|uniref:poly(A)-specific ribonuclease n=1 Tax=Acanthaster planci TaxID=133434 RepID=A0A8B8A1S9_ACAPL|nr:CCR4-NOT transcription complex subunit 6-like [Acanthaster planci]